MSPHAPHKGALFVFAIVFALCASFRTQPLLAADRGSVRIGLLAPASGTAQFEGADIVAGFQYYLASHGDRLGGFRVDLSTGDEGTSVETALATAHQLIERDSVGVIVGIVDSSDAYGIADYLDEQKIPLVIAGAGADELTQGKARKTFFRVSHTSSQDVMPLGDYVCRRLGKKRVSLVGVDSPYGWEAVGGFARAYTDAGCKIAQETYTPSGGDWQAAVAKIDRSVGGVFAVVGNADAATFLSAFRGTLPGMALYGDSTLTSPRILKVVREKARDYLTGSHFSATARTRANPGFRLGYERLTGNPTTYFVENGYVAAEALSVALDRMPPGPVKTDDLVRALHAVAFDAPRGPVRFDAYGQVVNDVYIRKVTQIGGRYRNDVIATYPSITQFWRYSAQKYLQLPTYTKLKGTWVKP